MRAGLLLILLSLRPWSSVAWTLSHDTIPPFLRSSTLDPNDVHILPEWTDEQRLSGRTHRRPLISSATSKFVDKTLEYWGSTGLSLAVIQRDDTISDPSHPGWRIEFGSYGIASTHTTTSPNGTISTTTKPVTPDTLFAIASNSKLFLSISVGLLISNQTLREDLKRTRGVELSWRTKMRDILGKDLWRIADDDIEKGATIQDLLSHRTGLPRHDFSGTQRRGGVREMIQTLRSLRPSATFRETFQYNNLMYETLSYLPPLLLNQSYQSYVAQHLFDPLNMTSTTFSIERIEAHTSGARDEEPDLAARMAQGHLANGRDILRGLNGTLRSIVPYFSKAGEEKTWAGAGGVISSARDLSTWLGMLLNDGKHPFTNETVVPKEVVEWVSYGRTVAAGKPDFVELSPSVYGAGIFNYMYRGTPVLEHGGNNPGFKTQVARFPAHNLGVIALSNDGESGGFVLESTKWKVVDELVHSGKRNGKRFVDWTAKYTKLWNDYKTKKREDAEKADEKRGQEGERSNSLGKSLFRHEAYGDVVPCKIPPSLDARHGRSQAAAPRTNGHVLQHPFATGHQSDYVNPHLNCTAFLELPSTRRILSSLPSSFTRAGPSSPAPIYISPFDRTFATHMLFTHFSGPFYNISVIWTNDELRRDVGLGTRQDDNNASEQDEGAMLIGLDEVFSAEYAPDEGGLAIRGGFWGMEGPDAGEPSGSGKEGAEVWFRAR